MNDLIGQEGEIAMTIQVTRKDTGIVEEYDLVGKVEAEQDDTQPENTDEEE
jgi:hypothetical protein